MSARLPTASKLHIARHCLYPWVDGVEWHDDDGSSFAASRGTFTHRFIAAALDPACSAPDVDPSDDAAVEGRRLADVALAWWRDVASKRDDWNDEPWCEVTFSCDVRGECVEHGRMRREDYPRDRIVGTADAYWFADDGALHVLDWKTGSAVNTEDVADNTQLRGLAAMLSARYGAAVTSAVVHLAFVAEDGVTLRTAHMTSGDLVGALSELQDMVWDLGERASRNPPQSGAHCRYCPVKACQARDGVVDALAQVDAVDFTTRRLSEEITGPEHAAWLVEHIAVAEGVIDRVKARLREYADAHGGVRLPDGRVWARRDIDTERIEPGAATAELLAARGLSSALTISTTKAAVEKASLDKADAKATLDALREAGLVRTTTTARYEARKESKK